VFLFTLLLCFATYSPNAAAVGSPGFLTIAPSTIYFGRTQTGTTQEKTVNLTNTGTSSLTITSVSVGNSEFSYSGLTLPVTLSAGETISFTASFYAQQVGYVASSLTFTSDASNSPTALLVHGTGTNLGALAANPASLAFGAVPVGSSSSLSETITNTGNTTLVITQTTGANLPFSYSGISLPITLDAGSSVTFTVKFAPTTTGSFSGNLNLFAATCSVTVPLTGSGTAPPVYSVGLTWDAPSGDIVGYNVYRGTTSGGPYSKLNSTTDTGTSYTDASVQYDTTYYYVTTSVGQDGDESAYSNQTIAVIPAI
jgi:hypothetical protein